MDNRQTRQKLIPILLLMFTVMATALMAIAEDTATDGSSADSKSTASQPQTAHASGGGIEPRRVVVTPQPVVSPRAPVAPTQIVQPRDIVQPKQ